ncbi:MAG: NfeD family protein [Eubacteriales bacterium]|nr:NfeD family protein [Eubacteriales bacterium]
MVIFWLGVLVVMLIVEIATMGLTTIWFGGGAVAALIAAALNAPIWLQTVLFLVVAILLLLATRPLARKYLNSKVVRTNADSLIGQEAVVTETIDNLHSAGAVQINGQEWTARSQEPEQVIPEGEVVLIQKIDGVKLICRIRKKEAPQESA